MDQQQTTTTLHTTNQPVHATHSNVRTATARWMLGMYILFSVASVAMHFLVLWAMPGKKPIWAFVIPTAGIGIVAWISAIWTRRSLLQAMSLFAAVSTVCVTVILVYQLRATGDLLDVLPMYYIGLFSIGLILGFRPALIYATILSLTFMAILLIFPAYYSYMILAIVLAYAAALPSKVVEALIKENLTNLTEINRKLAEHVAERESTQIKLEQHIQNLALLNRAGQAFNSTLSLDEVLANIMTEVRQSFHAIAWSTWLVDQDTKEAVCYMVDGPRQESIRNTRMKIGEGIAGWTVLHRETVLIPDSDVDPRIIRDDGFPKFEMRSILSAPLIRNGNVIGVIQVLDYKPNLFTASDQTLLELLTASAAIAIENAQLYEAAQQEIIERKRIEAALRASETKYRTLIETSPDSIVAFDLNGIIFMANPQCLALYNATRLEDIVGKSVFEFAAPEDRQRAIEEMQNLFVHGALHNLEYTFLKVDGTRFLAEIGVSMVPDADGQPVAFIGLTRDVTQRKQAEEATMRRNRELTALNAIATILNQTHDLEQLISLALDEILAVTGIDTGWIQLLANASDNVPPVVTGTSGRPESPPRGILPPGLGNELVQRACREGQLVLEESVTAIPPDGQPITFPAAVFPIKAQDQVLGALGVLGIAGCKPMQFNAENIQLLYTISRQIGTAIENIRLVKETAEIEALRELNRLRSELMANFSHDLRTPLGIIKMSCTTLLREDVHFNRDTQQEFLADIEGQADILSGVVDNMLDLARIEGGYLKLHRQPTDLGKLSQTVAASLKNRLAHHQVRHDFPSPPLIADVDPQHLMEVFRNLLDNAIKYSPNGGTITVSGQPENGHAIIRISDCGLGIPAEALERIFERFYRVENDTTRRISGVGLGLPVCRGIIEAHGGTIQADSTLGEGSAFWFTLPISQQTSS